MNYAKAILSFLCIQDVTILDIKIWKKKREVELKIKQDFDKSHCANCGLAHSRVHEWELRVLKAPPLGAFKSVTVKYLRLRGFCASRESKLKSFLKFAKTIRKYRINIEAYIKSRLTTAVSEGINNKIKVLKRMGYGYSNETSFRMKILQRCGFLNSTFIDTRQLFYSVPKP